MFSTQQSTFLKMEIRLHHFCLKPCNWHPLTLKNKILASWFLGDLSFLWLHLIAFSSYLTHVYKYWLPHDTPSCLTLETFYLLFFWLKNYSFRYTSKTFCIIKHFWNFSHLPSKRAAFFFNTLPYPIIVVIIALSIIWNNNIYSLNILYLIFPPIMTWISYCLFCISRTYKLSGT